MFINSSYFTSDLNIPHTSDPAIAANLNAIISLREKEYLIKLLGYELYKAFATGMAQLTPAQRYLDILIGQEYTGFDGKLHKWEGLIASSIDNTQTSVTAIKEIFFTVGTTGAPIDGATVYVNILLANQTYTVSQRALGMLECLLPDNSNIATAEISCQPSGGFTLLKGFKFSNTDKYLIELASPIVQVSDTSILLAPSSPIADYCFYWYLMQKHSLTTSIGQVKQKTQNGSVVSEKYKACKAWNSMVDKSARLYFFLYANASVYPEFVQNNETVRLLLTKIHPYF